jgi:hypothetical protein
MVQNVFFRDKLRQISVVVVPVHKNGILVVPHKRQCRARVGPMAGGSANFEKILLAGDDPPLVADVVANCAGIGEVGLRVSDFECDGKIADPLSPWARGETHKISRFILELGNKNVATVYCRSDQGGLLPALSTADLHHLRVH